MEKIVEQALLYDFYGELLTEHQKEIYEEYVLENLSLSEIAEQHGISRQGVHDLVKRCNKTLYDYEEKLHLVQKFVKIKDKVEIMKNCVKDYRQQNNPEQLSRMEQVSDEILEEL